MKRGQITLFIIVGIVLLLVLGLGIAAYRFLSYEKPPDDKLTEETNTEVQPVKDLIQQCLSSTGERVFVTMGEQGGYYDPADAGLLAVPGNPTVGPAFEPFPGLTVPYWTYVSSSNTCLSCVVRSAQPPLEGRMPSMQAQAERAIERELLSCIDDFAGLEEQFVITNRSSPDVTVLFSERDVVLNLGYELEVQTAAGSVSTIRSFSTRVDVPVRLAYEYAEQVRTMSDRSHFFEGLTMETVTIGAAGTPSIPPPYAPPKVSYDPGPVWVLPLVKERVAALLQESVGFVQVLGSRGMNYVNTGDPLIDNQYANYYFSIEDPAPDMRANFLYSAEWEPYLAIHPGSQVIQAQPFEMGLKFLPPIQRREFAYDVSYPLLAQVYVPRERGEYLLQFGLEVNVRSNQAINYESVVIGQPSASFCDSASWSGTEADITVKDQNGVPVSAYVNYDCVSQSCSLGLAPGSLATLLPSCIGGSLAAEKDGYVSSRAALDSIEGGEEEVELVLRKRTAVRVEPEVFLMQKTAALEDGVLRFDWGVATQNSFALGPRDRLVVTFLPRDRPDLVQVAVFPDGEDTVLLHPATYDISAVLITDLAEPLVIPAERRCYDGGWFAGDECVDIPEIRLGDDTLVDPETGASTTVGGALYLGGLQWDETTKNVTLSQAQLDRGELVLPVLTFDPSSLRKVEDLEVFEKARELSATVEFG